MSLAASEPFVIGPSMDPDNSVFTQTPMLSTAIYFCEKLRVFSIMACSRPGIHNGVEYSLRTSYCEMSVGPDGSYSIDSIIKQSQGPINGGFRTDENVFFPGITAKILGSDLYLFVLLPNRYEVTWAKYKPGDSSGEMAYVEYGTFSLPAQALNLESVIYTDGSTGAEYINLLYQPWQGTSSPDINYFMWDGNEKVDSGTMTLEGADNTPIKGPLMTLSTEDFLSESAPASQLVFTDSTNQPWTAKLIGTNPSPASQVTAIDSGTPLPTNPIIQIANGPLVDQEQKEAFAYFFSYINVSSPSSYGQALRDTPNSISDLAPFLTEQTGNVQSMFAATAYIPFPEESGQEGLFRVIVVGVTTLTDSDIPNKYGLILTAFASGQLIKEDPKEYDTGVSSEMPSDQKKTLMACWTPIGIVLGAPPYVDNGSSEDGINYCNSTSVEIEFSNSNSAEVSSSYQDSLMVGVSGGSFISLGASYTHTYTGGSSQTKTIVSTLTENFKNFNTNSPDVLNRGYILFNVPTITNTKFKLLSPDGSNHLNNIHLLQVKEAALIPGSFDMLSPEVHEYSDGLKRFPALSDTESWKQNQVSETITPWLKSEAATVGVTSDSSANLSITDKNSTSNGYSNSVKVSAGIAVLGFSSSIEGTWNFNNQVTTQINNSFTAVMNEIVLKNGHGKKSLTATMKIFKLTADQFSAQPDLLPDLYRSKQPWILTWQVEDGVDKE